MIADETYDVVGVGFGPANLALAIALREEAEKSDRSVSALFIESKPEFSWHEGMILPGTTLQVSFLKDLATLRDPQTWFSYLNYLRIAGRLDDFVNLRTFYPSRQEYAGYLRWAASHFPDEVCYGYRVTAIEPAEPDDDGTIRKIDIVATPVATELGSEPLRVSARAIVLGTGGTPAIPDAFQGADRDRVFHSSSYGDLMSARFTSSDAPLRVLVVGGGQSAAEIFCDLYARYPNARVYNALRDYGYRPGDSSEFSNRIFHPDAVDFIYGLTDTARERLLAGYRNTNYSVVTTTLIQRIYRLLYEERVTGNGRAKLLPMHEVVSVRDGDGAVVVELREAAGMSRKLEVDAVVLATGYERRSGISLLSNLAGHLIERPAGGYEMDPDYSACTRAGFEAGIFLQGLAEDRFGLSETLLSVAGPRAATITEALLHRADRSRQAGPLAQPRFERHAAAALPTPVPD